MITNDYLLALFPSKRSTDMSEIDLLILTKLELEFEEVDDKIIVKRKGEVLRDKKTLAPLQPKQVIDDYFSERGWTPTISKETAGIKTLSKFTEKWREENPGKTDISPEFDTALQKHISTVPSFDYFN